MASEGGLREGLLAAPATMGEGGPGETAGRPAGVSTCGRVMPTEGELAPDEGLQLHAPFTAARAWANALAVAFATAVATATEFAAAEPPVW